MNFSSSSPVSYAGVQMPHHGGPGTPIIPSPQDSNVDYNNLMKNVNTGMPFHDQNLGHMGVALNTEQPHHPHLNSKQFCFKALFILYSNFDIFF